MLSSLPKEEKKVFQGSQRHIARGFRRQRKRIAFKPRNDRINKISFKTFRTFKASTEIAKHRTLKETQHTLGHKSIVSTDYYVQLASFDSDEYTCQSAKTVEQAKNSSKMAMNTNAKSMARNCSRSVSNLIQKWGLWVWWWVSHLSTFRRWSRCGCIR